MTCDLHAVECTFDIISINIVDFSKVCEQSTDFHFANLEQQFESIGKCLVEAKDWRTKKKATSDSESDKMSTKSATSSTSDDVSSTEVVQ
jgi:hypothetical protein